MESAQLTPTRANSPLPATTPLSRKCELPKDPALKLIGGGATFERTLDVSMCCIALHCWFASTISCFAWVRYDFADWAVAALALQRSGFFDYSVLFA
ncbi:hypothetical protein R1flu_021793 [Riccia fluitans]|uniref:Uncharacterized protein n=1 Tax=Riccia fluitans TaxID=41844 RepID=A0ABD1ZQR2_9MARC